MFWMLGSGCPKNAFKSSDQDGHQIYNLQNLINVCVKRSLEAKISFHSKQNFHKWKKFGIHRNVHIALELEDFIEAARLKEVIEKIKTNEVNKVWLKKTSFTRNICFLTQKWALVWLLGVVSTNFSFCLLNGDFLKS